MLGSDTKTQKNSADINNCLILSSERRSQADYSQPGNTDITVNIQGLSISPDLTRSHQIPPGHIKVQGHPTYIQLNLGIKSSLAEMAELESWRAGPRCWCGLLLVILCYCRKLSLSRERKQKAVIFFVWLVNHQADRLC